MNPLLAASEGNALLEPSPGLMIWTLVTFLITLYVLNRFAFGPIQKALDARRAAIAESVEAAERTREEADKLLADYREQLASAKGEAEAIVDRARKVGDDLSVRMKEDVERQRQEQLEQTRQQVQAEVEKAMGQIRNDLADMTVTAAEKVLRGSLDSDAQTRLIEQAIDELDLDRLQKVGAS
jgi:F-type H+-transporting ATPase subunit b